MQRRIAHTYELCSMSAGEVTVLLAASRPKEIKQQYLRKYLRQYLRIRVDGRMLTIREAEEFCGKKWDLPHDLKKRDNPRLTAPAKPRKVCEKSNRIAVEQLDEQGNVIRRFDSMAAAAAANYIHPLTVQRRLKNKAGLLDGLYFRYAEKEEALKDG